jgi:hypothetical protein
MGFRYRKSLRLARGMRLNLTGRGLSSFSVGRPGSTLNFGQNGVRGTVGIPGSGLSYSSRLSSGSGMLPALIVALLTGIFVAAARGNRFAQAVLVAMVVGGALLLATHQPSGPVVPISISEIKTDAQATAENQHSTPSKQVGPPLDYPRSRESQPPEMNSTGSVRDESSESATAPSKAKAPDVARTIVQVTPLGSIAPGLSGVGTSNGRRSPASLLNLSNAADALRAQTRLRSLGYRVGRPDGVWGPQSQIALNEFRREHKLNAVAQWDEETQAALFSGANNKSGSDLEVEESEMPETTAPLPAQNSIRQ